MEYEQINDDKGPITFKVKMSIGNNPHGIPPGTLIDILITIIDEYETIRTSNNLFTRDLVKVAPKDTIAKYSDRLQKTIIKYPGKSMAYIAKVVSEDLKKIPVK